MQTQFALDLRLARRKSGFTQSDLAHLLATQQSVISAFEQGRATPTLEQIVSLSLIYGRSFESFFAPVMRDCKTVLQNRAADLPEIALQSAQTFNRPSSLARLKQRLIPDTEHGA